MRKKVVEVGGVYGRWTVVSLQTEMRWAALCGCACGTVREVLKASLNNGGSTSCGCVKPEKHGRSGSNKTYRAWANMKARCSNPAHPSYHLYGGRGVAVCDEWQSFEPFYQDMGEAPKGATLERKDTNEGYCKSNCIWTSHKDNCQNIRTAKRWHLDGQVFESVSAASGALGVANSTILYRCLGRTVKGKTYPPQPGCWAEAKYSHR